MAEWIIIGSGTGIPTLRRGSPGHLLLSEDSTVLVDSGSGTLRSMLEVEVPCQEVDVLLYTHTHPDHVSDLVPILFACKYSDRPREKDLLCIGGPGFRHYFEQIRGIYGPWIEPQSYQLEVREISEKPILFRDLKILSKPMAHMPESVGYRIELRDGKSVALSGDTDYCTNIVDLACEVDLLVLESSFPDERKVAGHLTPSLAGRIASQSRCKRLLLIHLYPVCDQVDVPEQCRRTYHGELIVGEDLMRIAI